jgi:Rho GTPase-activating protein 1
VCSGDDREADFFRPGLEEEGLFRRSPNSVLLRQVQEAYDRGNVVNLHTFNDPNLAAVLIKKYFRDLPEPIFPESIYPVIRRCPLPSKDAGDVAAVTYIRETLLPSLPPCAYVLLSFVLRTCSFTSFL